MTGGRHHVRAAGEASGAVAMARAGLAAAAGQRASLAVTAHRPWPPPSEPWVLGQTWEHLLFAHWPVAPDALRPLVPPPLLVDTFDGTGWLGVTPFGVTGLHPRGVPAVAPWSSFLEVNVRTYVSLDGRPGILFLSLDASRRLAAAGARVSHRLPYHLADMRANVDAGAVDYRSVRRWRGPRAALELTYRGAGEPAAAEPGSLTAFLVERYRLYTADAAGALWLTDIHHPPWRVRPAEAEVRDATLLPPGLGVTPAPPLLHLAEPQHTVSWLPRPALG